MYDQACMYSTNSIMKLVSRDTHNQTITFRVNSSNIHKMFKGMLRHVFIFWVEPVRFVYIHMHVHLFTCCAPPGGNIIMSFLPLLHSMKLLLSANIPKLAILNHDTHYALQGGPHQGLTCKFLMFICCSFNFPRLFRLKKRWDLRVAVDLKLRTGLSAKWIYKLLDFVI